MNYFIVIIIGLLTGCLANIFSDLKDLNRDSLIHRFTLFYRKPKYIIVEVITAGLFLYIYFLSDTMFNTIKYYLLAGILIMATVEDITFKSISNKLLIFAFAAGLLLALLSFDSSVMYDSFIAAVLSGVILLLIYFVSKGGIGIGDVKLTACTALFLGLGAITSIFFISVILSGLAGVVLLLTRVIKRKGLIPFAPFLLVGFIIYTHYM